MVEVCHKQSHLEAKSCGLLLGLLQCSQHMANTEEAELHVGLQYSKIVGENTECMWLRYSVKSSIVGRHSVCWSILELWASEAGGRSDEVAWVARELQALCLMLPFSSTVYH